MPVSGEAALLCLCLSESGLNGTFISRSGRAAYKSSMNPFVFLRRTCRTAVPSSVLLATLLFVAEPPNGVASDDSGHDHERARTALEAGEILPLKAVLERVEQRAPGKVLAIELERHRGRWIYELKVLRPGGALVKVWVDAADGSLIARRGHGSRPGYCREKDEDACPDR